MSTFRLTHLALLPLAFTPALPSCSPTPTPRPPLEAVVTIPEDYPFAFDAQAGQRLDEIMNPTGDIGGRCASAGGTLVLHASRLYICEGVDF